MPRELKPCGTRAAYCRHISRREEPCDPCKAAHAEYRRAYVAGHRDRVNAQARASRWRLARGEAPFLDPCGTPAAYQRHWRRGEVCQPCRDAWARYCRERRAAVAGA